MEENTSSPTAHKLNDEETTTACCNCPEIQDSAIRIIYHPSYIIIYALIVLLTLTLVLFDVSSTHILYVLKNEPLWFIILDIFCVILMAFDVFIQVLAYSSSYWRSPLNLFDFIVVALCIISVPIYFYVPESDFVLTLVLLLRFGAQLLRIIMIYKHGQQRNEFIESAGHDVDFSTFDDHSQLLQNQGHSTTLDPTSSVGFQQNPLNKLNNDVGDKRKDNQNDHIVLNINYNDMHNKMNNTNNNNEIHQSNRTTHDSYQQLIDVK